MHFLAVIVTASFRSGYSLTKFETNYLLKSFLELKKAKQIAQK